MTKRFTTIAASVAIAGLMGFSANASDAPSNTQEWAKQAGTAINAVMHYPTVAKHHGKTGSASYSVTINRDGSVADYASTSSSGTKSLDKAAERALNNADFPAIPTSFSGEQLSFSLVMDYHQPVSAARQSYLDAKARKQGSVTGTRIALLPSTSVAYGK